MKVLWGRRALHRLGVCSIDATAARLAPQYERAGSSILGMGRHPHTNVLAVLAAATWTLFGIHCLVGAWIEPIKTGATLGFGYSLKPAR